MKTWYQNNINDRRQMLDIIFEKESAQQRGLSRAILEKDWWVTMTLKALFASSVKDYLSFKGGTSLSKGWGLIQRFSEDIDLAIDHSKYGIESTSKSQREKLRKVGRKFVVCELAGELEDIMHSWGLEDCHVIPITQVERNGETKAIDSDKDPVVLNVQYASVVSETSAYMLPFVKVEISSLSMREPVEDLHLTSIIGKYFPEEDADAFVTARTVHPTRTFLEKVFLLCEEFQKDNPRTQRMSRHYYDIWQMMDSPFAEEAISNTALYDDIIAHREAYYHVHYIDYSKLKRDVISFLPPKDYMDAYRKDYDTMIDSYIYGSYPPFDELMAKMKSLEDKIHQTA